MSEQTNVKELGGKLVRIKGLKLNIIMVALLIPVFGLIYFIKINLMKEEFNWKNPNFMLNFLNTFLIVLILGVVVHEILRFIILKLLKINQVKLKYKDSMIFLYSSKPITIKKAKTTWLFPYLIIFITFLVSVIYLNFVFTLGLSMLLISTSDDLILYYKLNKFSNDLICFQEENFLGYTILDDKSI